MGLGGLNRLLLTDSDLNNPATAYLAHSDPRALHIRSVLSPNSATCTVRVALQDKFLHDAAFCRIHEDGSCTIILPHHDRRAPQGAPPISVLLAMQRPKVMARIFQSVATIGVSELVIVDADKVEATYWQCKLFRDVHASSHHQPGSRRVSENSTSDTRKSGCNAEVVEPQEIHKGSHDAAAPVTQYRRVNPIHTPTKRMHHVPEIEIEITEHETIQVHLQKAVQQAGQDVSLPVVKIDRRGLQVVLNEKAMLASTRLLAHPPEHNVEDVLSHSVVAIVAREGIATEEHVVLAIGPEAGWSEREVSVFEEMGFQRVGLGERVLRSETAIDVALGLVHEGLRWRKCRSPSR